METDKYEDKKNSPCVTTNRNELTRALNLQFWTEIIGKLITVLELDTHIEFVIECKQHYTLTIPIDPNEPFHHLQSLVDSPICVLRTPDGLKIRKLTEPEKEI